jgi:hypothetical protein
MFLNLGLVLALELGEVDQFHDLFMICSKTCTTSTGCPHILEVYRLLLLMNKKADF